MEFPQNVTGAVPFTQMVLTTPEEGSLLPKVLGIFSAHDHFDRSGAAAAMSWSDDSQHDMPRLRSLLNEPSSGSFTRPGIRGYRLSRHGSSSDGVSGTGADWSPQFVVSGTSQDEGELVISARDNNAGLSLTTRIQSLFGGSLRVLHELTNLDNDPYVVERLEVSVPLQDNQTEILDFSGRHENERQPNRSSVKDGSWVHENLRGKPSYNGVLIIAGTPGFGFGAGSVLAVQTAWSGNSLLAVDRSTEDGASIHAGEALLPGEVVLQQGEQYSTPWVVVTAADDGLDGVAHSLHTWQRSLPAHPHTQPVTLNVWEAVYMDHDFKVLAGIAHHAATAGVERYVLDDGWFHSRRTDSAGLGDWWVDPDVWPQGLKPLADLVHGEGMEFGLWFEPEMVNPDSDLFRAHPDWIMQASARLPLQQRHQYVLDLTNAHAFDHVLEAITGVLSNTPIDYVKWDHNRDLLEAGSNTQGGSAAVHGQTLAFYRLLDKLRERFPHLQWESCASGGGRIDMGVVEHVSRFWTSDMTDALSRQRIQRWTVQTVAPEYMGAHISAPTSHQSGRTFSLAFRAATAVFYGFGIEWNIMQASPDELEELQQWVEWYKRHRQFLHTGRYSRLDSADPAVYAYGVTAPDSSHAIYAHVQLDESESDRGVYLRIPNLEDDDGYRVRWTGPEPPKAALETFDKYGPVGNRVISGRMLRLVGIWMPRCKPETIRLIEIVRE